MSGLVVRELRENDVEGATALGQRCFVGTERPEFAYELVRPISRAWVAVEASEVVGYALGWVVAGEAQLMSIAVEPSRRGHGLGRALLARFVEAMAELARLALMAAGLPSLTWSSALAGANQPTSALVLEWRSPVGHIVAVEPHGEAIEENVEQIVLEVRAGNAAARALYEAFAFESQGTRKGYYADGEDGVLYRRQL
jgi:ribosomal protein S18 acetylase RimI-like enzyme